MRTIVNIYKAWIIYVITVVAVRKIRGDLSAPVLAIIVTIGIIAAGLVLVAWFWWFAPTAGKAGTLEIIGQPALVNSTGKAYISVRNVGNDAIKVSGVIVSGITCGITGDPITLDPGQSTVLEATCSELQNNIPSGTYTVSGVIQTNYGVYTVNLAVV
jgi:hypothetical protein